MKGNLGPDQLFMTIYSYATNSEYPQLPTIFMWEVNFFSLDCGGLSNVLQFYTVLHESCYTVSTDKSGSFYRKLFLTLNLCCQQYLPCLSPLSYLYVLNLINFNFTPVRLPPSDRDKCSRESQDFHLRKLSVNISSEHSLGPCLLRILRLLL